MNGSKPDTSELFRRISKLSSEAEWTPDEAREALSEAGVRPDDLADRVLQLVTRLKKESPFHWKNRAQAMRHELLEKVRARVSAESAGLSRPQLLEKLNEAISRLPVPVAAQYGVAFRKFEHATEEDLRSMLEEVALVEDLERDQS
jgi:dTDP-4-dehydrorhamnose reductase